MRILAVFFLLVLWGTGAPTARVGTFIPARVLKWKNILVGSASFELDDKMSRQSLWILGVQVAVLIAVVGVLAGG